MKKLSLSLIAMLAMGATSMAQAETVFHCQTKTGKHIYLDYDRNSQVTTYAFGKDLNSPEIVLRRTFHNVGTGFFNSHGNVYATLVSLPNGNTTYVITNAEYGSGKREVGVSVRKTKTDKEITFVHCKNNQANISQLSQVEGALDVSF